MKKEKIKEAIKEKQKSLQRGIVNNKELLICALLGAIAFIGIYGVHILNPCYTDWLLTSEDGDLTQHYLGWKFYRHSPWRFPLGSIDTLAYPNVTSVIFTDSIPLFAFFFKLIRFMLPAEFQYFGWYGILCFMLQGAIGAKLVKKYIKSSYGIVAGGLFFVLSPVFIDRMFWMTSLASHFLCLLGILYIVYYDEIYCETKKAVPAWGILGALCSSIHIYFLPMCGILLLGFMILDLGKGKKKWKALLPFGAYILSALITVFLFGGFGSGMKAENDGLGYYSFNLNGFYNPQGWSAYLKDMPYTDSQYEGFAYLGLGVLVLLLFGVFLWLGQVKRAGVQELVWIFILAVTVFAAASHVVMYGDKVLYEMPMPAGLIRLWSIFRASGRLIWPVVYMLVLGAVCVDGSLINKRTGNIALTVCLLLQIFDIKGILAEKNQVYNRVNSYQSLLTSQAWESIGTETEIRHLCFVSDVANSRQLLFSFGDYASDYGLTLSNFYFARSLGEKETAAKEAALAECAEDTAFVFFNNEAQKCLAYPMHYYRIDDLIVGCVNPLPDMEPLSQQELTTYRYDMGSGRFLNNGEVTEEGWLIHSYGNSYGPYLEAGAGNYQVTITGTGLTETDIKCYYHGGETDLEPQELVKEEGKVTFMVTLSEYAGDLEVALWNIGGGDITVTDMVIDYMGGSQSGSPE